MRAVPGETAAGITATPDGATWLAAFVFLAVAGLALSVAIGLGLPEPVRGGPDQPDLRDVATAVASERAVSPRPR